jgi:hypothetical protein
MSYKLISNKNELQHFYGAINKFINFFVFENIKTEDKFALFELNKIRNKLLRLILKSKRAADQQSLSFTDAEFLVLKKCFRVLILDNYFANNIFATEVRNKILKLLQEAN